MFRDGGFGEGVNFLFMNFIVEKRKERNERETWWMRQGGRMIPVNDEWVQERETIVYLNEERNLLSALTNQYSRSTIASWTKSSHVDISLHLPCPNRMGESSLHHLRYSFLLSRTGTKRWETEEWSVFFLPKRWCWALSQRRNEQLALCSGQDLSGRKNEGSKTRELTIPIRTITKRRKIRNVPIVVLYRGDSLSRVLEWEESVDESWDWRTL